MGINPIKTNNYWVLTKNLFNPKKKKPKFNPALPITLKKKKKALRCFSFLYFLGLQTFLSLSLALSLSLSSSHREQWGTTNTALRPLSLASLEPYLPSPFETTTMLWRRGRRRRTKWWRRMGRGSGENGVRGYEVECPPHQSHLPSADLACPAPISFAHHRSRLPTSLILPTQHRSLFSLSFFFFLPPLLTNLAWVFLLWLWVDFLGLGCCGFYFCGCGLALKSEFLALFSFFFFLS